MKNSQIILNVNKEANLHLRNPHQRLHLLCRLILICPNFSASFFSQQLDVVL